MLADLAAVAFCLARLALLWVGFVVVGVIAWLIARPKIALALLLTAALAGWHWQDKISDWFDARKIARLEREVGELRQSQADLTQRVQSAEASAKAAQDAAAAFTQRTGATRQRMRDDHEANRASAAAGDVPAIVRRAGEAAQRAAAAECAVSGACAD